MKAVGQARLLWEFRPPGEPSLTMDYDTAMDKIAYLLYQIGVSKKMIYHPIHGSGTSVGKKSILKSLICEELWGGFTGSGQ